MTQNWDEFLKIKNKTDLKGLETTPFTLRIPKELKKILVEDLRALEDNDDKTPMNAYILLLLMQGAGISQKEGDEFYRSKNNALDKHIKEVGVPVKRKRNKKST